MHVSRVRWEIKKQSDPAAAPAYDPGHEPRREPSIAVLPFRNLTGDPAHHFVAEGLVEDLIEALSRVPNFFVISRLSTLAFRNQDRHPREIGNVLGVRYVLSGSLRVLEDRLRLTIELTDTQLGAALWFSKLDERFADLFEVQDRLSEMIVRKVAPHLHAAEMNRIRVKRPDSLEAYDLFLRAQENMHNSSRAVFETSEALFDAAIAKDPHYAAALAWRAYWHVLRVGQGWSPDPADDATQADHFARSAIECNSMEPMAFAVHGHVASYLYKDFDLAFRRFETALRINANAAPAWLWSAAAHAWMGNGSRAIEEINKAMALSPYDPLMYAYSGIAAMAYLVDGQYERAIECALRSLRENRTYTAAYRLLVIALVLAGREDEARAPARRLLELEPGLTVAGFRRRYPGSASPHADLFCDALARAGIPLSGRSEIETAADNPGCRPWLESMAGAGQRPDPAEGSRSRAGSGEKALPPHRNDRLSGRNSPRASAAPFARPGNDTGGPTCGARAPFLDNGRRREAERYSWRAISLNRPFQRRGAEPLEDESARYC